VWRDITSNLPMAPVKDIMASGKLLFVASDLGVFRSGNGGQLWHRAGQGLPNAPITEIEFDPTTRTLFAASFGRGMYKLALS
jgi:hypothetical protein